MRLLRLKPNDFNEMIFDMNHYHIEKEPTWSISFKNKQYVTLSSDRYDRLTGDTITSCNSIDVQNTAGPFTLKDLERLEKWIKSAKEKYK